MWLSQRRRLLVLGPQTGRHSWEALSTGLTGSEKLLVLGVKVGRHAGGTGDSYWGLHFCVFFFCQMALDAAAAVAPLVKHWLYMRI